MPPLNDVGVIMNDPMPCEMEVDYDKNITTLYQAICDCQWDLAIATAEKNPMEAKTWVIRHYNSDANNINANDKSNESTPEIMWRFLPIHSACARKPPAAVISALLKAYRGGAHCVDDQGMYPLHYACGNQASREVVRLLLISYCHAAREPDPRGMLPIHYLACWGPSSVSIIDMVIVATKKCGVNSTDSHNTGGTRSYGGIFEKDEEGSTALDLALTAEYEEKDVVVAALRRWMERGLSTNRGTNSTDGSMASLADATATTPSAPTMTETPPSVQQPTCSSSEVETSESTQLLRDEITKLKKEVLEIKDKQVQERQETERKSALVVELEMQVKNLAAVTERLTVELDVSTQRVTEGTDKVGQAEQERDEMRHSLNAMEESHDHYKKRTEHMEDRWGSLSTSLNTMVENQCGITSSILDREERLVNGMELRRAKLQAMLDFENQFMVAGNPETRCQEAVDKQQKELEAMAVVLAAAKL